MVIFRVRLKTRPEFRQNVIESLLRVLEATRAAKGCIACHAYRDAQDEDTVLYVEDWETQEDLHEHLRARPLKILLAVIDLSASCPDVRFDTVAMTKGMEVIAAARLGGTS
jgi:quinol monooxygenase YgiN